RQGWQLRGCRRRPRQGWDLGGAAGRGSPAPGGARMNVSLPPTRSLLVAGALGLAVLAAAAGGWYWYDVQQRRVAAPYAAVMTRVYAVQSPQAPAHAPPPAQPEPG